MKDPQAGHPGAGRELPTIHPLDPRSSAALRLLTALDCHVASLYPPESNHIESPEALAAPDVIFVGCTLGHEVVGCGAAKTLDDDGVYGEIKRIYVDERHRGGGIARKIMAHLEGTLVTAGIAIARLETGVRQPEALGLYVKFGYVERGPFGAYRSGPVSVFMEKRLTG